jgi:serine/threonine protein kinase
LKNILSKLTGWKSHLKFKSAPTRIGDYTLVREIGSGATSNVYLGIHEKTFVSVAIKLLRRECKSDTHKQMFATEAALCGRLEHPNIVAIHEADLDAEDGAYLVLEYVNGDSMDKFGKPETLLPIDTVIDTIRQSAEALKHASGMGVIHRDVKPDNLIRTAEGVVKLTDFGCAITNEPNTRPIGVAGSLSYMSPEQLTGKPLNYQSDIYALGAVFYRLLTGRYSFDSDTAESAVKEILNKPHIPVESRRKGIPKELTDIIDRALQKKPEDRHGSWDEFIKEVDGAQKAMRAKYDYDFDMLRGFSETTLSRYLADTQELIASREIASTRELVAARELTARPQTEKP